VRKRREVTPQDVARWITQGHGQGVGVAYKPFFKVRDVPSRGRSRILRGLKTARNHHYLSDTEYLCHLLVEFSGNVIDIREQFALLPWRETQEIARAIGYRHPKFPASTTPTVITSDIVVTYLENGRKKLLVISVKRSLNIYWNDDGTLNISKSLSSREDERIIEKLAIEKYYWDKLGVPWVLATQDNIPLCRAKNINFIRVSMVSRELDYLMPRLQEFNHAFLDNWSTERTLIAILSQVAKRMRLTENNCFHLFGRSIWTGLLPVDFNRGELGYQQQVHLLSDIEIAPDRNIQSLAFLNLKCGLALA